MCPTCRQERPCSHNLFWRQCINFSMLRTSLEGKAAPWLPCSAATSLRLGLLLSRYEAATDQQQALQRPYDALARMLNCSPDNIAVLVSATSAWGQVSSLLSLFFNLLLLANQSMLCSLSSAGGPVLPAW